MSNLTEIDGVGPNMADQLREEGFETVQDVADSSVEELTEVKGIGETRADELYTRARATLDDLFESERVLSDSYNATTGDYEEEIVYYCRVCERGPFTQESTRDAHEDIHHPKADL